MRLVTAQKMGTMDQIAINEYGVPGLILMENAGIKVTEVIKDILGDVAHKNITVFVGKGNNGGDGFVIARHLLNAGAKVQVFLAAATDQIKGDALVNLNIWRKTGQKIYALNSKNDLNFVRLTLRNTDLIVDAFYGTGFKGIVPEKVAKTIEIINACHQPVVAVDVPSGLEADTGRAQGPCIKAQHTVTLALAKLGLVLPEAKKYVGRLHVVDISMPAPVYDHVVTDSYYLTKKLVGNWWPRRTGAEHKGNFGRVLILAGSRGLSGAAVLAAQAAARIGAGLVTLGVPASIYHIVATQLTEVMTFPLPETASGTLDRPAMEEILNRLPRADVLAVGPGLGQHPDTAYVVKEIILRADIPCVLDADALNAMVGKTELFRVYKNDLILTPHPGELARLTGLSSDDIQNNRYYIAKQKAQDWRCHLVLKGPGTVVANSSGHIYINGTGNAGMASGGSGDVLTGIIAGLVAQKMPTLQATAAGVFLHGLAGDLAAQQKGMAGMLATDLLQQLPHIIINMEQA